MRKGFFSSQGLIPSLKAPPSTIPLCGSCGLLKLCQSPKMPVDGKGRRRILIVCEAPGKEEDDQNKPLVGPAGRFLRDILEELGVDLREDCWMTNSLICRPPNNKIGDMKRIDYCRPNLINTIKRLNPITIIPMGAVAVKSLIGWVWKENTNMGIGRWIDWHIPLQKTNTWICPVWHPSGVMRKEKGQRDADLRKMLYESQLKQAFRHTKRPWKEVPNYSKSVDIIYEADKAAYEIRKLIKANIPCAFDYETTTLKPDGPHAEIYTCSISNGKTTISYPWYGEAIKASKEFLVSDVVKYGYNEKFERRWTLAKLGVNIKNSKFCGMLGAHVLDNRAGICSLKYQAFVLLGIESYDDEIKPFFESAGSNSPNRIREAPLNKLLLYNGLDSLLTHKIAQIQSKRLGV